MKHCETCGAELVRHRKHSRAQWEAKRFCDHYCASQRLVKPRFCACGCGERPPAHRKWVKGHRPLRLHANGYVQIYAPGHPMASKNGMAMEHRVIAFDAGLLRYRWQQIHHRNGVKTDNRLANLQVVSSAEHTRIHAKTHWPNHCPQGHEYTAENTAYNPQGWRYCKACNRHKARLNRLARKVAA